MRLSKEKLEQQKKERLGEIGYTRFGTPIKIIEYIDSHNIVIEVQDEYKTRIHTTYRNLKKGEVKNPYDKSVFGVGYFGVGKYKSRSEDGELTNAYKTWKNMIRRCYDAYELNKHPTYINCYVCEEWLNFQNFAKWFYKNYYEVEGQRMHLDKDILIKGNKIYSPETCIFVPERINTLFIKTDVIRGEYPIGVIWHKKNNSLIAYCKMNGKRKHLGSFPLNRPFQAFYTYKVFKENYIKQVADEYKDLIPNKLYNAMYNYQIEIND